MPTTTEPTDHTPAELERPAWLDEDQWPFPIREVDTVTYVDVGEGPTLLLVHVGMWSFIWRDLLHELERDFRCVVVEAPATGLSTGAGAATIADAASAITTIVESLDLEDVTLVFHDLGGPATLDAAADWPQRVRALVAVNSFGWRPSGMAFRAMLAVMGSRAMQGIDVVTGWLPRLTSTRFGVGRHLVRRDRRAFRRAMRARGRASFHRYMRSARRHDFSRVDRAVLALGHRPLLTVFGENNDPLAFQPQWAARFDDIQQLEVAGGNHFPMCDDPSGLAAAIAAWSETS